MEYLDYYDAENNVKLGVEERAIVHEKGLWHREVAVWAINEKNEILLQKRSPLKAQDPNKYSICAGHIESGEEIEVAALRELFEEVGLKAARDELITIGTFKSESTNNNHYKYTYLVKTDKKIDEYVLQVEEVSEVKYVTLDEVENMISCDAEEVSFAKKYYARLMIDKIKENM